MSAFGAGDLNSYMGGGGGDYETPSKASYGNNMQLIFLYLVAGVIVMFLLGPLLNSTPDGTTPPTNITDDSGPGGPGGTGGGLGGSGGSEGGQGGNNGGSSGGSGGENNGGSFEDSNDNKNDISAENIYQSLLDIDMDQLLYDLSESKTWTAAGDTNLVLKVLEKKTYDNSMIDNFDVELSLGSSGGNRTLEVKINPLNSGITRISKIEILYNDGSRTTRTIQDASMKKRKFVIDNVKNDIKKVTVYDTRGGAVEVSAKITVGDISVRYKEISPTEGVVFTTKYVTVVAKSEVGISRIEGLNKNGSIESSANCKNVTEYKGEISASGRNSIVRVRITDSNGFSTEVPVLE